MPGAPRTNPAAPRGAQADLAARLRQAAAALKDQLNSRDTLIELIRSVNATIEPAELGDALLSQAAEWFPAECLVMAVQDGSVHPLMIAERGPCVATRMRWSASLDGLPSTTKSSSVRVLRATGAIPGGPPATVVGFPLIGRERTIGALIALDSLPSSEKPYSVGRIDAPRCASSSRDRRLRSTR